MIGGVNAAQPRLSAFDLTEGFYLGHIVAALENEGILTSLQKPTTARKLALKHNVDGNILEGALRILSSRTNLITLKTGRYQLTPSFDEEARFTINQYLGAYGKNASRFARILRDPLLGSRFIDRKKHASAFEQINPSGANVVADVLMQFAFNHVLDLGCGPGNTLLSLATRCPSFVGWGVDVNPWMCRIACRRIADEALSGRISIVRGDCRNIEKLLPAKIARAVRTITAASLVNEFFSEGKQEVIDWLAKLKTVFPGRTVLIADYYAQLATAVKLPSREVGLHDLVQMISGQGMPPSSLKEWTKIYRSAGCRFIHSLEVMGSSYFIHIVKL